MNKLKKVLALHDFQESNRIGMQDSNSRYLTSFKTLKQVMDSAISSGLLFDSFENDRINHSKIEITLDDGGGSALLIAEYLKSVNIRGRFFIITSFIGNKDFLTSDEIKFIHSMGHIIGSHSHTHAHPFCELKDSIMAQEVTQSQLILEDLLCEKTSILAIPGGEIRNSTLNFLSKPKFSLSQIYTSTPYIGAYKKIEDCEIVGRLCIDRKMSSRQINRYLHGKDWTYNRLNYQIRRLRREIVYKSKNFFRNKS